MSNTNINGGPAFPVPLLPGQSWQEMAPCDGMTLRDYFAAKAMQLAFQYWRECTNGVDGNFVFAREEDEGEMDLMAVDCYAMADAMLKARES